MYATKDLLLLANRYAAARQIATSTLAREATGSSTWFERCATGRVTIRSATAVVQWLSDHWPKDLEWPVGIIRPQVGGGSRAGTLGDRPACITRGRRSGSSAAEAIGRRPGPEGSGGLVSPGPHPGQGGPAAGRPVAAPTGITPRNPFTPIGKVPGETRPAEYLVVATRSGEEVLTPIRTQRADAIGAKLTALNLTEKDVRGAVARAREAGSTSGAAPPSGER